MKKSKILIVDDDVAILDSLRRNLIEEFDVVTKQSGYEAVAEIDRDKSFKVILSDYKMPEMNGLDFLIMAKRMSPLSRRVLLTGYADLQIAMEAVNEGMVYRFLTKPCKTSQIIDIIKSGVKLYNQDVEREARATSHEYLAMHDSMTGLMNRAGLVDRLEMGRALARRTGKHLALLFMDLNNFKRVNDVYGHGVGDRILVMVSERLQKIVRATDTVARWGGDEFLVIIPDLTHTSAVRTVVQNIIATIDPPYVVNGVAHELGVCVGVSLYPQHSEDPEELITMADKAMYQAKKRSKVTGFSEYAYARSCEETEEISIPN